MFNKPFSDIDIADINNLITGHITEGQNLEFKKEVWGRSDEDVREMLRDISSIANGYGGYIVVGMEEDPATGAAIALHPVPSAGEERDRIFASSLANFQPRIRGLDIKTLEVTAGNEILLIKIPDSFDLHQITYKGLHQFWVRHDRQKTRMSTDEIKDAILKSHQSGEETQKLVDDRMQAIKAAGGTKLVLTATPIKLESNLFKIDDEALRALLKDSPERYGGWNFNFPYEQIKPSLHGLKIGTQGAKILEFYRNGYLEGITYIIPDRSSQIKQINGTEVEVIQGIAIVEYTHTFLKKLKAVMDIIGYDGQYMINLSLLNVRDKGLSQYRHDAIFSSEFEVYTTDAHIEVEPLIYENIDPAVIAKELLDRVWQAYGFEHEPYFDNGDFRF